MDAWIETPRLHMRRLAEGDEALYCNLYTDVEVMRRVGMPLSPEAAQRAFHAVMRQMTASPALSNYWVMSRRWPDEAIGLMALVPDRDDNTMAEAGVLLQVGAQGCGYAAEAIAALADHVFSGPLLLVLWTRHAKNNVAAASLMRKLGFDCAHALSPQSALMHWRLERETWLARPRSPAGFA